LTEPAAAHTRALPWSEFLDQFRWQQGEHVSLIGPTGGGKTTLALQLLPMRSWVTVLATKPADPTLSQLRGQGYKRIEAWPPPALTPRVLLWPRFRGRRDMPAQRAVIADAVVEMFASGGWCIYVDELAYLSQMLKLDTDLRLIWQQGRALKLTLMGATQRPAWVPLEMYSQATHLFFWRTTDRADLGRIGGLGGIDPTLVRQRVSRLRNHECLYVNTRNGEMLLTKAERR
jgi:hypothetical protein